MIKPKKVLAARLLPILIILVLGYSGAADAAPIIDFAIGPPHPASASISYAGGANPLVGTDLFVYNVLGFDTPQNGGVQYQVFGGDLDFTTGNFIGHNGNTWFFAGGGSITLYGGVDLNNNGSLDTGDIPAGTLLFSGTFSNASVTAYGLSFKITGASFYDTKDDALTEFFGLPNTLYEGNLNIGFYATGLPPNSFFSVFEGSGDASNSPVPEPATMLLFGCGLVGIGFAARKKFKGALGR